MKKSDTGSLSPRHALGAADTVTPAIGLESLAGRRRRSPADQLIDIATRTTDPDERNLLLRQAAALRAIAERRLLGARAVGRVRTRSNPRAGSSERPPRS
jgi:hypothetical protein